MTASTSSSWCSALNEYCLGRWQQPPALFVSGHLVAPFYCSVNMPPAANDMTTYLSGPCSSKKLAREQAAVLAMSVYARPALPLLGMLTFVPESKAGGYHRRFSCMEPLSFALRHSLF